MATFIKLSEDQRNKFFRNLKEKISMSWDKFYPLHKISRTMFFNYLSGRYDIPKELFDKWQEISKTKFKDDLNKLEKPKYVWKPLRKIQMDKALAEIFGVLNGDGHISKFKYEVCVVGDAREKEYFNYLKKLFEKKFKIPFTFFNEERRIKLRVYSKELSNLLTKNYNFFQGNKLGKLKVPRQIHESKEYLKAYIRGLFDTDGTIYLRRNREMVLEIISADPSYLKEIKDILLKLNFRAGISGKHIYIYDKENIGLFFKIIRPANSKHLKKFENYSNKARVV